MFFYFIFSREVFDIYQKFSTAKEIEKAADDYLINEEKEEKERRNKKYELGMPESDSDEKEEP